MNNSLKKNQSKVSKQNRNQYLDYFINPSFQGPNSVFVISFENGTYGTRCFPGYLTGYFIPTVEITDYGVMIDN